LGQLVKILPGRILIFIQNYKMIMYLEVILLKAAEAIWQLPLTAAK